MNLEHRVGPGTLRSLGEFVTARNVRRILLVAGGTSFIASGARQVLGECLPASLRVARFTVMHANVLLEDVERGLVCHRDLSPDMVLAIGGGRVIDCAKAIHVLSAQPASPRAVTEGRAAIEVPPVGDLVAVPTTAGSGSEATRFATVYLNGVKHSLDHRWLRPVLAIVDAELCASMPPGLTAVTGMDALCQAIESYWSVRATTQSRQLAAAAMQGVLGHLRSAVHDGDQVSRTAMSEAACLAGCAIDMTRTTAAHALSYPLTMRLGIPHGHAVALTLPAFVRLNAQPGGRAVNLPGGGETLAATLSQLWGLLGCDGASEAAAMLGDLMRDIGLATTLREYTLSATQRDQLAGEVNAERLDNNPVRVSAADVRAVLQALC
jgi:alcohol dehydrogenase class IV